MEKDNPDVLASTVSVQCPGLSKLLMTVLFLCAAVCCQGLALWLEFLVPPGEDKLLPQAWGPSCSQGCRSVQVGLSQRWRDRRPRAALAWALSTLLHRGVGWVPSTCSPSIAISWQRDAVTEERRQVVNPK